MRFFITACAIFVMVATSFADMTNATGDRPNIFTGHVLTASPGFAGGAILYCPSESDDPAYRAAIAALTGAIVDYFDARAATPDLALLMNYNVVYTWANFAYLDDAMFGNNLAAYVDAGGRVVLGAFCTYTSGNSLAGTIMTAGYCPVVSPLGDNRFSMSPYAGDGVECVHNGVTPVTNYECTFRDCLVLQGTGIQEGSYLDGEIAHAYRDDFNVFYSNGSGAIQLGCPGEWASLIANMAKCFYAPSLCASVGGFAATDPDCETDTIDLSWTVNMGIEAPVTLELVRDGSLIASLPATDSSYTDTGVSDGPHTYAITVTCTAGTSATRTVTVDSVSTGNIHVVWRANCGTGLIDSASAIGIALDNAGQTWIEVTDITAMSCIDASTVVWAITGTFPDNSPLDAVTGDFLVAHVTSGGPLYFEGGDTWGFDAQTNFQLVDGIEDGTAFDGDDTYISMDGTAGNIDTSDLVAIAYTQDQAGNDHTDQIFAAVADSVGANSTVIWTITGGAYNTGVAYETDDPNGNVVSQSWEFGGFGGDQDDLMSRYLGFLEGGAPPMPGFLRGDLNSDGGVDISDAIFGLSALFVPGSPTPACLDSADVNSDGGFDISDMIFLLSSLFVPGSPSPAAPFPACGPGPIVLGCGTPQC